MADYRELLEELTVEGSRLRLSIQADTEKLRKTDNLIRALKELMAEEGATPHIPAGTVVEDAIRDVIAATRRDPPGPPPVAAARQAARAPVVVAAPFRPGRNAPDLTPEPLARPKARESAVTGWDPRVKDRTTTRRFKVLMALTHASGPLSASEIGAAIGEPVGTSHQVILTDLLDEGLAERDAERRYVAGPNAAKMVNAARQMVATPGELAPLEDHERSSIAICPRCVRMQVCRPIGWDLAGGRKRLVFQCAKCSIRFYNDVRPADGRKDTAVPTASYRH